VALLSLSFREGEEVCGRVVLDVFACIVGGRSFSCAARAVGCFASTALVSVFSDGFEAADCCWGALDGGRAPSVPSL
jgi:hypothetical protein